MPKYDHHQHILSDWLAELDQRFQLGEVGEDTNKITWCQLLIGATGFSILSSLNEETTWEDAKEVLLTRLGIGSVRDEAWAGLKNLKKRSKDIVELAGEAEKLAKRLHPRDEEASERHAGRRLLRSPGSDFGCRSPEARTQDDGRRRSSRSLDRKDPQRTDCDTKMERLVSTMQDQIRLLKKDPKRSRRADPFSQDCGPASGRHGRCSRPNRSNRCSRSTASCHASARHVYQDYGEEPPFYRPPHCQMDRRPPRCFLCGEEGHFVSNCPARPVLQRLLRQEACASARAPPQG